MLCWGNPDIDSESCQVPEGLRDVQQIQASGHAFAAILADGSVTTWGDPDFGGDSSIVKDQLSDVQQIISSRRRRA